MYEVVYLAHFSAQSYNISAMTASDLASIWTAYDAGVLIVMPFS